MGVPPNPPRPRILIVEDDPEVRSALSGVMHEAGGEVEVAGDGAEALERLRSGPLPAVILFDVRLPRLGGEDFLRRMRGDPRFEHIPVITMSGGSAAPQASDVVARLHRPVDLDDLRKIVVSLFEFAV